MKSTRLVITTPDGLFMDKNVYQLIVRTADGYRGFLPSHSPIISSVEISELRVYETFGAKPKKFAISGGLIFVNPTIIEILTINIEAQEDIDIMRAEKEKARLVALLKTKQTAQMMNEDHVKLMKEINRISVHNSK